MLAVRQGGQALISAGRRIFFTHLPYASCLHIFYISASLPLRMPPLLSRRAALLASYAAASSVLVAAVSPWRLAVADTTSAGGTPDASEPSASGGQPSHGPLYFVTHMPKPRVKHAPILFLMHGYGSDEQDLISMAASLPSDLIVVSFRAPYSNPSGGYKWFDNHDSNGRLDADGSQIASSRVLIETSIALLVEQFDADPKRVFIGGFSQGAIMTYALSLTHPERYRGGVVMSGAVLNALNQQLDPKVDRSRLQLFVGHGTADQRIPFAYADTAVLQLRTWHVALTFKSYAGMGHEVSAPELADISAWLMPLKN